MNNRFSRKTHETAGFVHMLRAVSLLALLVISVPSIAWPQKASVPPKGKLFPHDLLAYFSGAWHGSGRAGSGDVLESDFTFTPDLKNQCLVVREKEKPPHSYEWIALWSVDSMSGEPVMLLVSNGDWGARMFRSQGWHQGKIVFQGEAGLRAAFGLERFTFERKSDTVFDTTYELSQDNGRTWLPGEHQEYIKASSH